MLYLGPPRPWLEEFLSEPGDTVVRIGSPLEPEDLEGADAVVSYGYRHLIGPEVIARFGARLVNLHISFLPFNRGADPNLWSFLEDTPKGVSIHVVDEGLDTGPLVARREVSMAPDDTLATSYERLSAAIEALFRAVWPSVRDGLVRPVPQPPGGSLHRSADKRPYGALLTRGWDTPVSTLVGKATGRDSA